MPLGVCPYTRIGRFRCRYFTQKTSGRYLILRRSWYSNFPFVPTSNGTHMGKNKGGKIQSRKENPDAMEAAGLKEITGNALENYSEIADKYTVGEAQPAPNLRVRHPNRNNVKSDTKSSQKKEIQTAWNTADKVKDEETESSGKELSPFLTKDELTQLSIHQSEISISAYMETGMDKNGQKDMHAFKNVLQKLSSELKSKRVDNGVIEKLLKPGFELLKDDKFWTNSLKGLAVFISDNQFVYMRLPVSPKEEILVNSTFYMTPLIPMITARDYFYLLVLSKKQAKLYRADEFGMVYITIPEMPHGIDDVVHFKEKDEALLNGDEKVVGPGQDFVALSAEKPDEKQNIATYFDEVDETLWKAILNKEKAPLLLAGVEYLIPIYKSVAKYNNIWNESLTGSYEHSDGNSLYQLALKKMESYFQQRNGKALEMYGNNSATALTSSIPAEVISAAHYSKVSHLFVQKGEHIWGRFDQMKNEVIVHDKKQDGDECMIDKAVLKTIQNGGEVHFMEKESMPEQSKIAALMRY